MIAEKVADYVIQGQVGVRNLPTGGVEPTGRGHNKKDLRNLSEVVGNQQKWDTFVKERSGGNGSVVGLPEQVVVAFAAG